MPELVGSISRTLVGTWPVLMDEDDHEAPPDTDTDGVDAHHNPGGFSSSACLPQSVLAVFHLCYCFCCAVTTSSPLPKLNEQAREDRRKKEERVRK